MAIIYRLENQRVAFHWDRDNDIWTAKSDDVKGLNLQASSFNSMLYQLKKQHPEFANSIRIFSLIRFKNFNKLYKIKRPTFVSLFK